MAEKQGRAKGCAGNGGGVSSGLVIKKQSRFQPANRVPGYIFNHVIRRREVNKNAAHFRVSARETVAVSRSAQSEANTNSCDARTSTGRPLLVGGANSHCWRAATALPARTSSGL